VIEQSGLAQRQAALESESADDKVARLVARAKREQQAGNFAAALDAVGDARQLVADDPRLEALRVQLVAQRRATQRRAERSGELEQHKSTAGSQQASGNFNAAMATVDSGLEVAPGDRDLLAMRASILAQQRAESEKTKIEEQVAGLTETALRMRAKRDYDGALAALEEAISLAPNKDGIVDLYSQIYGERRLALRERRRKTELGTLAEATDKRSQNAE